MVGPPFAADARIPGMLTVDRVAGSALAFFAIGVLWECRRLPLGSLRNPGPAYAPAALAVALLVLGVLIAFNGGRSEGLRAIGWSEAPHALLILAVCALATFGLERLGYRITMVLALGLLVAVIERQRILLALAFALALPVASYYLFDTLLRVQLPRGPWGW